MKTNLLLQLKKDLQIHIVKKYLVKGPSKIIYGGNDKAILSCGARVVIETESEIEILR
jgi:hypothetical protein